MSNDPIVQFLLEPELLGSAIDGNHPFIAKMALVLESASFRVDYCLHSDRDDNPEVFTLSHMKPALNERGLVFRRVYEYPFWQIEASANRWEWDVARSRYDPAAVDAGAADQFYRFWQKRQYQASTQATSRDGFVYVPLQGKISEHRSFQSCSPIDMIEHCLSQDPKRAVIATIHPNETYSADDIARLETLERRHARLRVDVGEMVPLLQTCDYVVTQNSSVAFAGYFFQKPALLFGKVDFHHIAVQADMSDLASGFDRVAAHAPDYARYLYWFWQMNCINAGRDDVYSKITARFRQFGWPID